METPARQFKRVLVALEELAAQEERLLLARDYAAVVALQLRAAPLVECLTKPGAAPIEEKLRQQVSALIARRTRNAESLARELNLVRNELAQIQASQRRIGQVAPAYRDFSANKRIGRLSALR